MPRSHFEAERQRLSEWQGEKLRESVAHMTTHSTYWARRFADEGIDPATIRHPDDLFRCPTLTKHDYVEAVAESPADYGGLLCADLRDVSEAGALIYHTTGTSGTQGKFINTDEDFGIFGRQGSVLLQEAGAQRGDFVMVAFPLALWAAGWGLFYGAKDMHCTVVPAGAPINTAQRIQLMQDYRPSVVALTPSYALTLGKALGEAGVDPRTLGVKGILMGGETFSDSRRARIEKLWSLPGGTRSFYGISEGGPLFAVECSAQDGLHLFEEDTIHQFWRLERSEPAAEGELAEHVFTSISQRTMATWFNFRTRDASVYRDSPCSCGRTSRRMWIRERLDDMVKVRGVNIFASGVEQILSTVPGFSGEFRLVVERKDEHDLVTVQVETEPGVNESSCSAQGEAALKNALGTHIDVAVVERGTLPRTELKARRWLDLRPKD